MTKKITLAFIFCFSVLVSNAQWSWLKKTSCPGMRRDKAVAFSIGNYGYVGTGLDTANIVHADFWRYDSVTNTWTQKADFGGGGRNYAVGISINGKGYIGTGLDDSDNISGTAYDDWWEYDTAANTWTAKAAYANGFSNGIYKSSAVSANGKGYVICGKDYFGTPMGEVWEYDPLNDSWTQKNNFPPFDGRDGGASFSLNGNIYFGCGADNNYLCRDFWEFNPSNNLWNQKSDFPGTERSGPVAFSLDSLGFIGLGLDGGYCDDFYSFNPNTNQWHYVNLFDGAGRRNACAFTIGNRGYVYSGKTSGGVKRDLWQLHYTSHWAFSVDENKNENSFSVFPNPTSTNFQITNYNLQSGCTMNIYNLNGEIILQKTFSSASNIVDVSNFHSGIYVVQLLNSENKILDSQKLIVQ